MPVILPARSGYCRWMRGKILSPSICFWSCGVASASIAVVNGSVPPAEEEEKEVRGGEIKKEEIKKENKNHTVIG